MWLKIVVPTDPENWKSLCSFWTYLKIGCHKILMCNYHFSMNMPIWRYPPLSDSPIWGQHFIVLDNRVSILVLIRCDDIWRLALRFRCCEMLWLKGQASMGRAMWLIECSELQYLTGQVDTMAVSMTALKSTGDRYGLETWAQETSASLVRLEQCRRLDVSTWTMVADGCCSWEIR